MPDIEKVIKGKEHLDAIMEVATHLNYPDYGVVQDHCLAILALLKEQEEEISKISNAYLDLVGKASKQPEIVRCKDCKHRGDRNKCIVAFVAEKQEIPYFFYDNRGDWFCADGERKEVK